jgi:hypothetical protein
MRVPAFLKSSIFPPSPLSVKEKAKLMILDLDQKLVTGKGSLNDEEISSLKTFDRIKELGEYNFIMGLRDFGAFAVSQAVEICMYRFMLAYHLISQFADTEEDLNELRDSAQSIYNEAVSYKALSDKLSETFDFPVLGEFYEEKVKDYIEHLEIFKEIINHAVFVRRLKENPNLKPEDDLFIKEATINEEMYQDLLDVFKKNGSMYYNLV